MTIFQSNIYNYWKPKNNIHVQICFDLLIAIQYFNPIMTYIETAEIQIKIINMTKIIASLSIHYDQL